MYGMNAADKITRNLQLLLFFLRHPEYYNAFHGKVVLQGASQVNNSYISTRIEHVRSSISVNYCQTLTSARACRSSSDDSQFGLVGDMSSSESCRASGSGLHRWRLSARGRHVRRRLFHYNCCLHRPHSLPLTTAFAMFADELKTLRRLGFRHVGGFPCSRSSTQ